MMAGFLPARSGIDVTVVEKYPDFFRDFRGDTIHPSTLEIIHELGLLERFLGLPHDRMSKVEIEFGGHRVTVADFTGLPVHSRFIAFVPQWDFLSLLADEATRYPNFTLLRETAVTDLLHEGDTVVGIAAERAGEPLRLRADLVIGADGRHSVTRRAAGLIPVASAAPIDVFWFRLPRRPGERAPLFTGGRGALVSIDRGEYWQLGYAIPHGAGADLRAEGLNAFRTRIAALRPAYSDRLAQLDDWAQIHELTVRVDHLRRWHRPGLLCIGDAAHAMSPAGGVGINLAIQDAVATANLLGPILRDRTPTPAELDAVRRRRLPPARITQMFQNRVLSGLYPHTLREDGTMRLPAMLKLFDRLRELPAEAPSYARPAIPAASRAAG